MKKLCKAMVLLMITNVALAVEIVIPNDCVVATNGDSNFLIGLAKDAAFNNIFYPGTGSVNGSTVTIPLGDKSGVFITLVKQNISFDVSKGNLSDELSYMLTQPEINDAISAEITRSENQITQITSAIQACENEPDSFLKTMEIDTLTTQKNSLLDRVVSLNLLLL